jgi:hypothetical protein
MSRAIDEYYSLSPTLYRDLVSLLFTQGMSEAGVMEQRLELILARKIEEPADTLCLSFDGVRELHFVQSDLSLVSFSHVEITDSGSHFDVRNEDRLLRFRCRQFHATIGSADPRNTEL